MIDFPRCEGPILVKKPWLLSLVLFISILSKAQSNDVGFLVGGVFSPDSSPKGFSCVAVVGVTCAGTLQTSTSVAYEGVIAHRLINLHLASLHLELPVVGTPNRDVRGFLHGTYSSVFFTPGLRLKVSLPGLSPFVAAGAGVARFSTSNLNTSNTVGALQLGGGVDLGTPIPLIGLRVEVREFYTGESNFSTNKQNLFVGGGIVLKF